MMHTDSRPRRLGLLLIAAGLLGSAACGSDDGAPAGEAKQSAAASTPAAPRADLPVQSLVLPADAFPAGFTVQEVPLDQTDKAVEDLRAATEGAQVTPAGCAELNVLPERVDTDTVGLAVASKDAVMVSMGVAVAESDLARRRESISGECGTMTMTLNAGDMKGMKTTLRQKLVKAPATRAKDVLVVDQTSTSTPPGGAEVTTTSRVGSAAVNGYIVTVQYRAMNGGAVDTGTFDEIFVKAVDRVVEKTS